MARERVCHSISNTFALIGYGLASHVKRHLRALFQVAYSAEYKEAGGRHNHNKFYNQVRDRFKELEKEKKENPFDDDVTGSSNPSDFYDEIEGQEPYQVRLPCCSRFVNVK